MRLLNVFNYEPMFNSVFSKHNLSKTKDGSQDISLGDRKVKEKTWILDCGFYSINFIEYMQEKHS